MSSLSLNESLTLEAELSRLHLEMRSCTTEEEFQSLKSQHSSIIIELKLLKTNSPNLNSANESQKSSLLSTPSPHKRPLQESDSKNLEAVSWYLTRVSDKVEELNIKTSISFRKLAGETSASVDEVIKLLKG